MAPPPALMSEDGVVPKDDAELSMTLERLLAFDRESEWIEFKENNADPREIGEYISALANSAALEGQPRGYIVWGVQDQTFQLVGTAFDPHHTKVGQEELQNHLQRTLEPKIHFSFHLFNSQGHRIVMLEVQAANSRPIRFHEEFIRIGSYKKRLRDFPDHERRLWRLFDSEVFELAPARDRLRVEDVVSALDYPAYYDLSRRALPENRSLIIEDLQAEGFLTHTDDTGWAITNFGALLFAKDLEMFETLSRKAPRVILYKGVNRIQTVREQIGRRGYAAGFRGLVGFMTDLLPENELIKDAIRTSDALYPELALRELTANTLVHQDLRLHGTGPTIEIFSDRIEFTNPGRPLIVPDRFVDSPPQSRNERLARAMRRLGICEERGSGWDKVLFEVEYRQLPPPLIEVTDAHTRVVLFAPRSLRDMEKKDRIRAIYQHACLTYVSRQSMTNSTVRKRFGLPDSAAATASRLIKEGVEAGLIAAYDPTVGPRALRYLPFWAEPDREQFA